MSQTVQFLQKELQTASQRKTYVYISTGEETGFYTLRKVTFVPVYDGLGVFNGEFTEHDHYVQNLSTDPKLAEQKCAEFAKKHGYENRGIADFTLEEWYHSLMYNNDMIDSIRKDSMIIFGEKHFHKSFKAVIDSNPDYIRWILDTADHILSDVDAAKKSGRLNRLELTAIVIQEMITTGELYLPEKPVIVPQPELPSSWIGEISEKIEFQGTCVFWKRFETRFGSNVIYIVKAENGDVVKFFSTSVTLDDVDRGDWVHIKGTVKSHDVDEYRNNNKVTQLTRVKCVDHVAKEEA